MWLCNLLQTAQLNTSAKCGDKVSHACRKIPPVFYFGASLFHNTTEEMPVPWSKVWEMGALTPRGTEIQENLSCALQHYLKFPQLILLQETSI